MRSIFFSTRANRVALARQRYFEDGELPSGVVSEAVFQSWARCLRLKQNPGGQPEFQEVSPSRAQLALQKNRLLRDAWLAEASELDAVLGATNCGAMLIGVMPERRLTLRCTPSAMHVECRIGMRGLCSGPHKIVWDNPRHERQYLWKSLRSHQLW